MVVVWFYPHYVTCCLDNEILELNGARLEKLGTIDITLTRVVYHGHDAEKKPRVVSPQNIGPIHERTKKIGGHCVS